MVDQEQEMIRHGIRLSARALGIDPIVLATAISYETAGTFNPTKKGPTTKYGQHEGFIQFGKPQAKQNGVNWKDPIRSQLGPNGAVVKYLRAAGVKPGMGLKDVYSAINAGRVGRYGASDEAAGGAPGTVADKVAGMSDHQRNAVRFMGGAGSNKNNFKQTVDDAVVDAAPEGPFPAAPRNYSDRTTGPVMMSDRNVDARDTRIRNPMDPNSLVARMMKAGGRQSSNVEDVRDPVQQAIQAAQGMPEQQGPDISQSPEWQKALETFMVHYNREPATDSDFEIVANLMKGVDLTNEDVQDQVLQKMDMGKTDDEQSEATPDDEAVEGEENGNESAIDQKAYDNLVKKYGPDGVLQLDAKDVMSALSRDATPQEAAYYNNLDPQAKQKLLEDIINSDGLGSISSFMDENDPNISGKGGPSDAEVNPQNMIMKLMGVR